MSSESIHLLVVDSNAAVRRALALRLSRANDIRIIDDTGDLDTALAIINRQGSDVVILESKRRDGAALRFCQQILEMPYPPGIIVLTSFANEDERLSFLHLGVEQYLLKDIDTEELIRVVREQALGREQNQVAPQ